MLTARRGRRQLIVRNALECNLFRSLLAQRGAMGRAATAVPLSTQFGRNHRDTVVDATGFSRRAAAATRPSTPMPLKPPASRNVHRRAPVLRGVDGPLIVKAADPLNELHAAGLAAAVQSGYRRASDISGGLEVGFGAVDLNIIDGQRQSAADAYLRPALERPNLTLLTDAVVGRLVIEHARCIGVEYRTGKLTSRALAAEVVLTAGAIGSAHLLMSSGIGPQSHLAEVGIDVQVHLPGVGAICKITPGRCSPTARRTPSPRDATTTARSTACRSASSAPARNSPPFDHASPRTLSPGNHCATLHLRCAIRQQDRHFRLSTHPNLGNLARNAG